MIDTDGEDAESGPDRVSTGCAAGWSRSAGGSTFAVARSRAGATFTVTAWLPVRSR